MGRGPVIFWSDGSDEALVDAFAYIKRFSLTMDDVSLIRRKEETVIYAKHDISEKLKIKTN